MRLGLPDLDAPPPAPWGERVDPGRDTDPQPEEGPEPVQEPWSGQGQPIREPESLPQRWKLH